MAQKKRTLFLYCEESLHAGAGSSTGTIDLPIQRERHTNFPKIESSSLRGAIREASYDTIKGDATKEAKFIKIYGKKDDGTIHSAVDFTDARILFFPVRSYHGVFAWITCPLVLERLQRDYKKMCQTDLPIDTSSTNSDIPKIELNAIEDNTVIVQEASTICSTKKAVFEEFIFDTKNQETKIDNKEIGEWIANIFGSDNAIINRLKTSIALVSNDVFRDFVVLYTHKITRNKIDSETGTADGVGLFNEEFLPPESILYSFITASEEFSKNETRLSATDIMCFVEKNLPLLFRAGGDKGIGKGLLRKNILPKNSCEEIETTEIKEEKVKTQ